MSALLVDAYREYYEQQGSPDNAKNSVVQVRRLVSALVGELPPDLPGYMALNDALFALWKEHVGRAYPTSTKEFFTSGSTRNASRRYMVGPHADLLIRANWDLTKFPYGFREVIKLESITNRDVPVEFASHPTDPYYAHTIQCGLLNSQVLAELLKVLRQFLAKYPACSLISVPDSFLYLNHQPAFQDFVIEHRDRFNLMSQNWEPFFKRDSLRERGVHINDAMTDWTTGLNFYTCREGFRHMRPIVAWGEGRRVNLLNLIPNPHLGSGTEEDVFEPKAVSRCRCGQNRLDFEFFPHQTTAIRTADGKIVYDLGLAEKLQSSFLSLQFLQEGETVSIFYRVEGPLQDQDLLETYFTDLGFRVAWRPDDAYVVGLKRPVFFRYPG